MDNYDIRFKITPSIPIIVKASECIEITGYYKFFIEEELVFIAAMNDILYMRVTKE